MGFKPALKEWFENLFSQFPVYMAVNPREIMPKRTKIGMGCGAPYRPLNSDVKESPAIPVMIGSRDFAQARGLVTKFICGWGWGLGFLQGVGL